MKQIITIIAVVVMTFAVSTKTANAGWFDNEDQQQINKLEDQLQEEQHKNEDLTAVVVILGVGCVVVLVVGTAIGSRTRRAAKHDVQPKQ